MKKYIKQIILLAFVVSFVSCTEDEEVPMTSVGGSISGLTTATPGSISRLDNNVPITFKATTKQGVSVNSVEIYRNTAASATAPIILGDKVADATIGTGPNGEIIAVYNSSTLGSFNTFPVTQPDGTVTKTGTTGTFSLAVRATFSDGTSTLIPYVQTVAKGIVWKVLDSHGDPVTNATSGVTSFKLNDPTPVNIRFAAVKKAETTLTSIVGEYSKNGGAFSSLPLTLAANTTTQTVDIAAIPYSAYGGLVAGDKITYKFTVTAGTQTDFITTTVTVADQLFDSSHSGSISQATGMDEFNLGTAANEDGEIMFLANYGFSSVNETKIEFVLNSGLNYDEANLFDAANAFDAGTPVTSATDLTVGSVVLYKITRNVDLGTEDEPDFQDVTHYGLLKVTELTLMTGVEAIQGLKFSYKEGELLE